MANRLRHAQFESRAGPFLRAFRRNWIPLALASCSIALVLFWQFRFMQSPLASRIVSVSNLNDFSWRNRVTVWAGSTRMLAARPLLGYGWGRVESAFARSPYRAPRLEETMAIQLNDYFTLGLSAGAPALLCFLGCAALGLFPRFAMRFPFAGTRELRRQRDERESECCDSKFSLPTICRAACVLMLVGFWFDGGLFRLPTCPLFWTLLAFSRLDGASVQPPAKVVSSGNKSWWGIAFRCAAGLLVAMAAAETVFHLALPRLPATRLNLRLSRKWLVPPAERNDFDYLAANPVWAGKPVGVLVEHVRLADYNRRLVSWELDEDMFRTFVLSPQIDPGFDGAMDWRRPLWEYFYPRIRRASDAGSAAQIVAASLRERVKFDSEGGPASIRGMWERQMADASGFEVLLVAALRSVGVAARVGDRGQAQFFADGKWRRRIESLNQVGLLFPANHGAGKWCP